MVEGTGLFDLGCDGLLVPFVLLRQLCRLLLGVAEGVGT